MIYSFKLRMFCHVDERFISFSLFQTLPPSPSTGDRLFEFIVGISQKIQEQRVGIQVHLVATSCDNIGNISGGINATQFHKSRVSLDSCTNQSSRFGFSLCFGNDGLLLLLSSNHNVFGTFRILLGCKTKNDKSLGETCEKGRDTFTC